MCRCEPITDYQRVYAVCVAVRRRVANLHKSSICAYGSLCACACRWCSAGGARWLFNGCPAAVQRAQRLSGASGASGVRVGHAGESWPELVVLRRSSDGARVAFRLILAIRWRETSHVFDFWRLFSSRATPNTPLSAVFDRKMPVRGYFYSIKYRTTCFLVRKAKSCDKKDVKRRRKNAGMAIIRQSRRLWQSRSWQRRYPQMYDASTRSQVPARPARTVRCR